MMTTMRRSMMLGITISLFIILNACTLARTTSSDDTPPLIPEDYYTQGILVLPETTSSGEEHPESITDFSTLEASYDMYFLVRKTDRNDGTETVRFDQGRGLISEGSVIETGEIEVMDTVIETEAITNELTFYYSPDLVGDIAAVYVIYEHSDTKALKLELANRYALNDLGSMSISINNSRDIDAKPYHTVYFTVDFVKVSPLQSVSLTVMDEDHSVMDTLDVDLDNVEDVTIEEGAYVILEEAYENRVERTLIDESDTHRLKIINDSGYATIVPFRITMD